VKVIFASMCIFRYPVVILWSLTRLGLFSFLLTNLNSLFFGLKLVRVLLHLVIGVCTVEGKWTDSVHLI